MSECGEVRGWAQCREALLGREMVSEPPVPGLGLAVTNNLLFMEGDRHKQLRRIVAPYFTASRVSRIGTHLEDRCQSLVRAAVARPEGDFVADVTRPLALDAIMSVMEIPGTLRERLGAFTQEMVGLLEPGLPPPARRGAVNATVRATLLFERDRLAGNATGLRRALEVAAGERVITEKLARSTPVVVLHGGYENPLNQLGCVTAWAVEQPGEFKRAAAASPGLLFEEVTRVFSPVRRVARWAVGNGGGEDAMLEPRMPVWIDLESANHDGKQFAAGDEIDLSKRQQHLGFGYGRHACPGAVLARLEGQALIGALSEVPDDVLHEFAVEWRDGFVARGPASISRRRL